MVLIAIRSVLPLPGGGCRVGIVAGQADYFAIFTVLGLACDRIEGIGDATGVTAATLGKEGTAPVIGIHKPGCRWASLGGVRVGTHAKGMAVGDKLPALIMTCLAQPIGLIGRGMIVQIGRGPIIVHIMARAAIEMSLHCPVIIRDHWTRSIRYGKPLPNQV